MGQAERSEREMCSTWYVLQHLDAGWVRDPGAISRQWVGQAERSDWPTSPETHSDEIKNISRKSESENKNVTDWSSSPERGLRTGHQSGNSVPAPILAHPRGVCGLVGSVTDW